MVSPIAHEDLGRAHWPDGSTHNANLKLYTAALEEVRRFKRHARVARA